jgi:hypothetical protein
MHMSIISQLTGLTFMDYLRIVHTGVGQIVERLQYQGCYLMVTLEKDLQIRILCVAGLVLSFRIFLAMVGMVSVY